MSVTLSFEISSTPFPVAEQPRRSTTPRSFQTHECAIKKSLSKFSLWMASSRCAQGAPARMAWWQRRARQLDPRAFNEWEHRLRDKIASQVLIEAPKKPATSIVEIAEQKKAERKLAITFALAYAMEFPAWDKDKMSIALQEKFPHLHIQESSGLVMTIAAWRFCARNFSWNKTRLTDYLETHFPEFDDVPARVDAIDDLITQSSPIIQARGDEAIRDQRILDKVSKIMEEVVPAEERIEKNRHLCIDFVREYMHDHPGCSEQECSKVLQKQFPEHEKTEIFFLIMTIQRASKKSLITDRRLLAAMKRDACIMEAMKYVAERAWTKESLIRYLTKNFPENEGEFPHLAAALTALQFTLAESKEPEQIMKHLQKQFPEIHNDTGILQRITEIAVADQTFLSVLMGGKIECMLQHQLSTLMKEAAPS